LNQSIAFLGLGRMGLPMAARLLAAGHSVAVWNRSPDAAVQLQQGLDPVAASGLRIAAAASEAVVGADLVITMLSDGPAVRAVLFADPGVAVHVRPGACLIDMSSIPPVTAREHARWLAERGIAALDAPVSGGVVGARAGQLAIMVGGEAEVLRRAAPALAVLGRVTHVGPVGAGQLAKLANQVIVGITIGAVAEALLLAARGGADPLAVRAAIRGGFAESRILELHGARMLEDDFAPGGAIQTQVKDLLAALEEARGVGLDLPITRLLCALFERARDHGDGGLDHSALLRELGRHNHLPAAGLLAAGAAQDPAEP
jgi:2-hydroxy-3-oxopropionate reductase